MFNSKKNYVSPEVNVILVGEDIMNGSNERLPDDGVEFPELPMGK